MKENILRTRPFPCRSMSRRGAIGWEIFNEIRV